MWPSVFNLKQAVYDLSLVFLVVAQPLSSGSSLLLMMLCFISCRWRLFLSGFLWFLGVLGGSPLLMSHRGGTLDLTSILGVSS